MKNTLKDNILAMIGFKIDSMTLNTKMKFLMENKAILFLKNFNDHQDGHATSNLRFLVDVMGFMPYHVLATMLYWDFLCLFKLST